MFVVSFCSRFSGFRNLLGSCFELINTEDIKSFVFYFNFVFLRASLCKILISSLAHKMDFAHNFSVDFF